MIGRGVRSNRKSTLAQGADVPSGPSQARPRASAMLVTREIVIRRRCHE